MVIIVKGGTVLKGHNVAQVDSKGRILRAITRSGNDSKNAPKSSKSWNRTPAETIEEAQKQEGVNKQVITKTFNSQAELDSYNSVANKLINDLNASNKRINEKKVLEQQKAQTNINSRAGYYNPTQASFIANTEREYKDKYAKDNFMYNLNNEPSRLNVEQGVRYAQLSGKELNQDFFFSSRAGKEFLYDNSVGLQKLLPSKESKELFFSTNEGIDKDIIKRRNFSPFVEKYTPNAVKNEIKNKLFIYDSVSQEVKGRRENIDLINAYYDKKGIERTKNFSPWNPERASKLGNNLFNIPFNTNNVIYEQDLIKESNRAGWRDVGSSFKAGYNYIKEVGVSVEKDASFDFKAGLKESFKTNTAIKYFADRKVVFGGSLARPPTERELTGIKMIGYSASSVFTNAVPYVGAIGTEAVDVSLARKDYYRAWFNPTPYNKAIGRMELVDVGADLFTGGFAPNVNLNINQQVSVNEAIKKAKADSSSSSSSGSNFVQPLPPLKTSVSSEVGFSNVNNTELVFGAIEGAITRIGMGFKAGYNFVTELDFNLPALNMNKSEVGFGNKFNNDLNNEVNNNFNNDLDFNFNNNFNNEFNNNFNNEFNNQFNNNFNNNVNFNSNYNFDSNFNFNNNFNFDTNLNLNLNFYRPSNKLNSSFNTGRSFTPFVKFGNLFAPISRSSKDVNTAFDRASYFIKNSPENTFAVSSSALNFSGLDVKASKGFKKKRTNRGVIFSENKSFGKLKRVKL